jgi:hypothetical protein
MPVRFELVKWAPIGKESKRIDYQRLSMLLNKFDGKEET